jgi:RimJ/RimL family protein N-acetyltransferase
MEAPACLALELAPLSVTKIIGPAFIGYATAATFKPRSAPHVRELRETDAAAVLELQGRCTEEEWEHGGSEFRVVPTFGAFTDAGKLSPLAGYEKWGDEIAHIAIVSAADCRKGGFATAAVAAAAGHALSAGLLPQYRTLRSNQASIRVAEKLGFVEYGVSTYVKFAAAQPHIADGQSS